VIGPALLFCPADRPDRYQKALVAADTVILDLEDAVAPDRKATARQMLVEHPLDRERVIVRVNPVTTPEFSADLEAVKQAGYRSVMLAKTENAADLDGLGGLDVIALCETARGVLQAVLIAAHPTVSGLMWGAEDLAASLGGQSSRFASGVYRDVSLHARSTVLLAAGAHGKAAIDSVWLDIANLDGLAAEASDAAASGFVAKACIHPSHAPIIRDAYAPTDDQVAWAERVTVAASAGGVVQVDGQMIDAPLRRQAERVLAARRVTSR
jgi:citrate lyase subunit beta/citryl-CoA lyase